MLKLTKPRATMQYVGTKSQRFIAGWDCAPTNASPAPKRVPEHDDRHRNRSVAAATAACVGIPHINPDDHRSMKKNFLVMTLAPAMLSAFCFFRSFSRILYLRL
jgi:hypothetical protein